MISLPEILFTINRRGRRLNSMNAVSLNIAIAEGQQLEIKRKSLISYARGFLRDLGSAEEVVQDALAEAYALDETESQIANIGSWLMTVVKNKSLDLLRRRKTAESAESDLRLVLPELDENSPEQALWAQELREALLEAVDGLPAEQRQVFVLHEIEDLSFEEIAERTGVSINTLLSRKRYAIQKLRESLQEVYDGINS